MDRTWDDPSVFSALLLGFASEQGDAASSLLELATGLRTSGHRARLTTVGAETLATCAGAIFHALSAEPTHIIHAHSLRGAYAAMLACFAFTARHPCSLEPAIVTTLYSAEDVARASRRLPLPSDYFIVSSERARAALIGGEGRHRLSERAHVIVPGARGERIAATLAVYRLAWERRQRENRQALLAFEA